MQPNPPPAADDPVEDLVFECLEAMASQGTAALDRACAAHPEHAAHLRQRIQALRRSGLVAPDPAHEPIPERLGEFRLLRRLGGGGMGVVYLAHQESLGRDVALKLIRPEHLYFAGSRQRFQREVTACARLSHPGIVPIHLVGEAQGIPYFAMEHIAGASLAETLAQLTLRDPATLSGADLARAVASAMGMPQAARPDAPLFQGSWINAVVRVAAHIADALAHAHERGVVHRDIKPSNVMLTREGRVLVVDFGLAQSEGATRLTRSGSALGSLLYMPPEVVRGSADTGAFADLYSLGATLYELLTLAPAFPGSDAEATRRRILLGNPAAPRQRNPAVPWDVETVCLTAMALEPQRRYPSAAALATDLRNVLELRPITARRPGPGRRLRRAVQRNPTGTLALLLAFVLLVVVPLAFALHQRAAHQDAERRGYAGNVAAAANSLRLLDVHEAWRLLANCAEELRRWEWRQIQRRAHRAEPLGRGREAAVEEFQFAPDGRRALIADCGGWLVLRDATGLRELQAVPWHLGTAVPSVAWRPDGARFAAAGMDGAIRVWDAATVKPIVDFGPRLPETSPHDVLPRAMEDTFATLYTLAWSPDGRRLATGGLGNELRVQDAADPDAAPLLVPHPGAVRRVLWLPDGKHVVTACSDGGVRFVDAGAGTIKRSLDAHRGGAVGLALSADGERLATSGSDRVIRVWNLRRRDDPPRTLAGHTETVGGLAFDPTGHWLASCSVDGTARLWNPETGDLRATWCGAGTELKCVRFAPDGQVWGSGRDGRMFRFATADVDLLARVRIDNGFLLCTAPNRDGTRLFAAGMVPAVMVFDAHSGVRLEDLCELPREPWHLALSPDGNQLAVAVSDIHGPGEVRLLDLATGRTVRSWTSPDDDGCHVVAFAPDGASLAFCGQGGGITLARTHGDAPVRRLAGHTAEGMDLCFSADGRWLASAGNDRTVRLWSVADGSSRTLLGHAGCVNRVRFSPDGTRLFSGSLDRTIRVWDPGSGTCVATLTGHHEAVRAMTFTPDGSRLLSGCFGGVLRTWDLATLQPLASFLEHQGSINHLSWSPDGTRLYSTSMQGEIRVW